MGKCVKCNLLPVQADTPLKKTLIRPSHEYCNSCLRMYSEKSNIRTQKRKKKAEFIQHLSEKYQIPKSSLSEWKMNESISVVALQRKLNITFATALSLLEEMKSFSLR